MSERDHEANPDPGHPHGETLPDESPTEGEAAQEKADEWGAKAGRPGRDDLRKDEQSP